MRPWAYQAHEAHLAHKAHLAHPAHQAYSAMSMLDCPNDFHIEDSLFSAFQKKRVTDRPTIHPTDRRTDGWTRPHIEIRGRI